MASTTWQRCTDTTLTKIKQRRVIMAKYKNETPVMVFNFFCVLFCKYNWMCGLEYTKCKYISCICTNSDPFCCIA